MNPKRLTLSLRKEAMKVTRAFVGNDRLVYVIVADRKIQYPNGRSRIAYFGTTQNGVSRVAESAASRTEEILTLHGVRSFVVHLVTCRRRRNVKTWLKLERAFLLEFREKFGAIPVCNSHGKAIQQVDEFEYFARARINGLIDDFG